MKLFTAMRVASLLMFAAAIALPFLGLKIYTRHFELVNQQGGLFDGQSSIGIVFIAVGFGALLGMAALVLYLASWPKKSSAFTYLRAFEIFVFCMWLYELWWFAKHELLLF
jgi:hypothetical protein